jgi:hypothetical protein
MIGVNFIGSVSLPSIGTAWQLVGVGDFNFDARNDLLFRNTNGKMAVWFMNGSTYLGSAPIANGKALGSAWNVVGPK